MDIKSEVIKLTAENYYQSEIARMLGISRQRVHQILNPLKDKARSKANRRKFRRLFKVSACEQCKEDKKLAAHHHDYSQPLQVTWLCIKCHGLIHRNPNSKTGKCDKCGSRRDTSYHQNICSPLA